MAQPRLASRIPRACAACYGQYADRLHVDYAAAFEGALIDPNKPRGGHVDWLVICEKCLRNGVALLPEEKGRTEALEQQIADLQAQLAETQAYADKIEDALSHRPSAPAQKPRAKAAPRKPRYEKAEA